jgi:hypothetical protein
MTNPGRYLVLYPTGQASPLPNPNNPTQTEGAFPFSANPGDQIFQVGMCQLTLIWMPNQSITFRLEFVYRNSSVPYFAGQGGVTSADGLLNSYTRPKLATRFSKIRKQTYFSNVV